MRAVVQRVSSSRVTVDERVTGEVKKGLFVWLGVTHDDTSKDVDYMVDKVTNLRIFEDENDKMNLSLKDVQAKFRGKKDSYINVKILREEEYENFWGKKMTRLIPIEISNIPRSYEIDRDLPIRVFKNGDEYNIKMNYQNKNLSCHVVYRKEKSQYLRVLSCSEAINEYNYSDFRTDIKIPVETWINFDKLIFKKYNEYSLWHNSPNPIITGGKELQLAKLANPAPPKNGDPCGSPTTGGVGVWKNGSCYIDMTKDMTEQEKEDYFRYKDFEEDYENYLKFRNGVY